MASNYPGGLDELTDGVGQPTDPLQTGHVGHHTAVGEAVEAVQAELGLDPAGAAATVRARLDTLDTTVAGKLAAVVGDAAPQLGGQLDVNGQAVGDGTRELLAFVEDPAAVNHVEIENEAAGAGPMIRAAGDDTNIPLRVNGKGTGNIAVGTGDAQHMYNATTAQRLSVRKGTNAAPDVTLGPLVKVERTLEIAEAVIGGDGVEQLAAIEGIAVGTAGCETQPVGVTGMAKTSSTVSNPGNDACGVYGVGRVTGSGNGVGIGGFFAGRVDSASGRCTTVELANRNMSGSDHSPNTAGHSASVALWMNATGDNRSAVGISMSNAFGRQFHTGLLFTQQTNNGLVGPTEVVSIHDKGVASTSLLIEGTHATAAIAVAAGAGPALVGGTSSLNATALFEVQAPNSTKRPLAVFGATAHNQNYSMYLRNSQGIGELFVAAGVGSILTGTAAGDTGVAVQTTGKRFHLGGTVSTVAVTRSNELGFHNSTPIAKPAVTGSRAGNAALDSLLTALADYGLITNSTSA